MSEVKLVFDIPLNNRRIEATDRELNHKWLDYRIRILCRFTLPSLAAQRNQDFHVLIGIRAETRRYICRHKMLRSTLRRLKLLSRTHYTTEPRAMDFRRSDSPLGAFSFVLTAHLDSDDLYHPNAVDEMLAMGPFEGALGQAAARNQEIIRYSHGYFYEVKTGLMHPYKSLRPPFFAQVFSPTDWVNPAVKHIRHHTDLSHCHRMRVITNHPRYIVTIHGQNKLSRFRGSHWGLLKPKAIEGVRREFPSLERAR